MTAAGSRFTIPFAGTSMMSAETQPDQQDLRSSRFEILSRIAEDLAHEIRNPIHSMLINLEVLKARIASGSTEIALERASILELEIRRLHRLVDPLLLLLRPDAAGVQTLDASSIIAELAPILETQAKRARAEFRYDVGTAITPVCARRDDLAFAILILADVLLDSVRNSQGGIALSADCVHDDVRIRIAAWPGPQPDAETTGHGAGILLSPDPCDAVATTAAELVRDAGGRVLRGDAGEPASRREILIVLPRCTRA